MTSCPSHNDIHAFIFNFQAYLPTLNFWEGSPINNYSVWSGLIGGFKFGSSVWDHHNIMCVYKYDLLLDFNLVVTCSWVMGAYTIHINKIYVTIKL